MPHFRPTPADKFTFGLWTVGNPGRDPFGDFVRPALDPCRSVSALGAARRLGRQPARQRPRARSTRRPPSATASSAAFKQGAEDTGLCVPMATTNLFTDPVFKDGAFTSHDPRVRAYACRRRCGRWISAPSWAPRRTCSGAGAKARKWMPRKDPIEAIKWFREAINFLCEYAIDQKYGCGSRSKPSPTSRAATSTSPRPARTSASSRR